MPLARLGSGWLPRIDRVLQEAPASCDLTLAAPDAARQALAAWLDLVVAWGERVDLTAARDPDTLADLLLADAAVLAATIPLGSCIDIGSGVGAPALPLAVLVPALELTLVEPRAKRTAFLRTSLGTLARPDVALISARSTEVQAGAADIALSRATLPPPLWLREGTRLARRAVWVLLAQDAAPELAGWQVELELRYRWPLTGAPRRALRYGRG